MKLSVLEDATDHISSEAVEGSATSVVPAGTILVVVRSGILAHSLPVAKAGRPLAFNQDIKALTVASSDVEPEYLYWFIRSSEAAILNQGVKKGPTVHSLQSGFIENLQVPILPLVEQQRIVDLLSRAEGIVRLRCEAQRKAVDIIPTLFLDMFGDPAMNPRGWRVTTVGEIASYTRYGPRFADRRYADAGAHIMRTTDIDYDGGLRWYEAPILPMSDEELAKYSLRANTLLITRTGATIGKTALFRGASRPCIAGAYLIELGLSNAVMPDFALHFFLSPFGQSRLIGGSRAVAQPNLNAPTIRQIRIPLPDLKLQRQFADIVAHISSIQTQQAVATAKAEVTFDALLASVFAVENVHG